eukprot:1211865-Pyramimonas_sp.AAC.1
MASSAGECFSPLGPPCPSSKSVSSGPEGGASSRSAAPLSHPPTPRHRTPQVDQRWAFSSPSVVGDSGRLVAPRAIQRIA